MNPPQALHLGIIPDGNRRWAKKQLLRPWDGHRVALENSRALLDWCRQDDRIGWLTLWGFSTENWDRDPQEVSVLMELFVKYMTDQQEFLHSQKTRFVHSGRRDRIPTELLKLIEKTEAETKTYQDFTLNLAIDYGGRDEIIRAASKLSGQSIDADTFRRHFDQPDLPDFDLIIRTSGEHRTSGFAVWQAAYAEWYFEPKLFPDLKPSDIEKAVIDYSRRHRRFGR